MERGNPQDGVPSWSRQVDMPRIRALGAERRLINSRWIYRCDIVVLPYLSFPSLGTHSRRFPQSASAISKRPPPSKRLKMDIQNCIDDK